MQLLKAQSLEPDCLDVNPGLRTLHQVTKTLSILNIKFIRVKFSVDQFLIYKVKMTKVSSP